MKFILLSLALTLTAQQVMAGGPIEGCLQTHTVVAGDSCEGIAATFKLTPEKFYGMNPGLHHAGDHLCDNLDDGKKYCVCTEKPCVDEPVSGTGNSTTTVSGPDAARVDIASPGTNAAAASPASSSSPKSPSTVARSVTSSESASSAAVSNLLSGASLFVIVTALSSLTIVSL